MVTLVPLHGVSSSEAFTRDNHLVLSLRQPVVRHVMLFAQPRDQFIYRCHGPVVRRVLNTNSLGD